MDTCQVCNKQKSIGVASGACGPVSIAYCRECLQTGAEPFDLLTAYLGCGGLTSMEHVNPAYRAIIEATCKVANKTIEEFFSACAEVSAEITTSGG
jgi:hypothetical protein